MSDKENKAIYLKPVQIKVFRFHRVSGGLNLAVRFNARKDDDRDTSSRQRRLNRAIVVQSSLTATASVIRMLYRAVQRTAKFKLSLRDDLCTGSIYLNRRSSRHLRGRRLLRAAIFFICAMAIAAATVIGCGWNGTEQSVRFSYLTLREMARLPPLPHSSDSATNQYSRTDEDFETDYRLAERRAEDAAALWTQAKEAEESNGLETARRLLRAYLERTTPRDADQQKRNSAFDRLDALTALDHGSTPANVRAYLNVRRAYDEQSASDDIRRALDEISPDVNLHDNAVYLRAAILYRENNHADAARLFTTLAAQYPRSEKREAALFMAAVATMKQSVAFTEDDESEVVQPAPEARRDAAWHATHAAFLRVMREYPRGRYANDARGWLAHLHLRGGDRASALIEYYRLLADRNDVNAQNEATISLRMARSRATDEEMRRVQAEIIDEPAVALTYAYHNIYNYSLSAGYYELRDEESCQYHSAMGEREAVMHRGERAELSRIVGFTTEWMRRNPHSRLDGGFALRMAQAILELGDNDRSALTLARRALDSGVRGDERAEALWVKGIAEYRLQNHAAARTSLNRLVAENPRGRFTEGARRFLAMAAEDVGDTHAALEQYIALDYEQDVAYFVDVLMTPEQLARFIAQHPGSPKRDEMLYALGIRHLRAGRYTDARTLFAQVRATAPPVTDYERYSYRNDCRENYTQVIYNCSDPKEPEYDSNGVRAEWILRDVRTADALERLERAVETAHEGEAKAEAMYQLASYIYESSELLFYNPAAWQGRRFVSFHYDQTLRTPGEAHVIRQYMEEHETLVRALRIYLEIARLYPQTRAARDALYTAAVCHNRLSRFQLYWPAQYRMGLNPGDRMVTYADVRRSYPSYQLPRGTYGWQPSTRTVNGGQGWSSPPPRPPRLTRMARAQNHIASAFARATVFWRERGRDGLITSLLIIYLPIVLLIATQTRAFLRREMERARYRPSRWWRDVWSALSAAGRTLRERHDGACVAALDALTSFGRFAIFDRRGRAAIILNTVAHAVLLWLALALWRALFSS